MISQAGRNSKDRPGFTLVELLAAVAVIAVGMVFVLGAFSQCITSLDTAQKMIDANYLLNARAWEIDLADKQNNGTGEGEWSGVFAPPNEKFNWTRIVRPVSADFGQEAEYVQQALSEEVLKVSWPQGKIAKDISVTRYVRKKQE